MWVEVTPFEAEWVDPAPLAHHLRAPRTSESDLTMDTSTAGVTLNTGFVFDVLREYEDSRKLLGPLFAYANRLDPSAPDAVCPIDVYNDACQWIEKNIGLSSIRNAGRAIAERVHDRITSGGRDPKTPIEIVEALKWAADNMIQDPRKRGWVILAREPNRIVVRRTQTFNCIMQEGLLIRLLELTDVTLPSVDHAQCTRRGAQYCEYELRWLRSVG